jgi:hypothetical protein
VLGRFPYAGPLHLARPATPASENLHHVGRCAVLPGVQIADMVHSPSYGGLGWKADIDPVSQEGEKGPLATVIEADF